VIGAATIAVSAIVAIATSVMTAATATAT